MRLYSLCVQGIKVVDSDSKKRALEALDAERKEHEMEVDEPVEVRKPKKKAKKKSKKPAAADTKMQE